MLRPILILLLLSPLLALAGEVETELFKINLPDTLSVETDKVNTLIAFGESGPYAPPFLSIEFSKEVSIEEIKKDLENELESTGAKLSKEACIKDCEAWYSESEISQDGIKLSRHHYLSKTKTFSFIISYGTDEGLASGKAFVQNLAAQIHNGI